MKTIPMPLARPPAKTARIVRESFGETGFSSTTGSRTTVVRNPPFSCRDQRWQSGSAEYSVAVATSSDHVQQYQVG